MVWPTPCVRIDLDRPRRLRLTFGAMKTYENVTGKSLLAPGAWTCMLHEEVWALLWVCLVAESPSLTMDEVGDWVGPADLPYVIPRLEETIKASVPDAPNSENEQGQPGESPDWLTLWTIGTVDLGLSDAEFWALTPREYAARLTRHRLLEDKRTEDDDFRAGVIAAAVINMLKDPKAPAIDPRKVITRGPAQAKEQNGEQMLQMARLLNQAFGGNVIEA